MISQQQILSKVITDRDYSIISLNNLTAEQFFNYKDEFEFIKNHLQVYNNVPDSATFLNHFPEFELLDVKENNAYLINSLLNDYKTKKLADIFNYVKDSIEQDKDSSSVMNVVSEQLNKLNNQSAAIKCTDITSDISRYDRYLEKIEHKDDYYFSTGLKELDEIIGGIDVENENMVISARTGIGKTWMLMIIAAAAAEQRKTVGLYSGEMTVDKVASRIDTILGSRKKYNFTNSAITKGDELARDSYHVYLEELQERRKNNKIGAIKVITPNDINGPATVDALRAFVERENIEILLIDQYSLLEDTSHAKIEHERVANISKAVKLLQVAKHIPIISVSQNNRTGDKDKDTGKVIQDTTQIALSDRIGQDATVILMLSRDKDKQTGKDLLKINILKSRDGGDGTELVYDADFDKGIFTFIPAVKTAEEATEMQNSYEPPQDLTEDKQETIYDPKTGEYKTIGL